MTHPKKIIIIESAPGARLTNQLWNFASVYAYCLEKGFVCENHSFFEYKHQPDGQYSRLDYNNFFDLPRHGWLNKILIKIHLSQNKFCIKLRPYDRYVNLIKTFFSEQIIYSDIDKTSPFYLPPSENQNSSQQKMLSSIEASKAKNIYFCGWLFRNPAGLKKYHIKIKEYFYPKKEISAKVDSFIQPLRKKYRHIVGVHIRQTDYQTYRNGSFFFKQEKIKIFLENYLQFFNRDKNETLFILCSDGPIDKHLFNGLNIKTGPGKSIEDFFTLAQTDIIIGSDSTFSAFAAYLGNIPFAVFAEPDIDWKKINLNSGFNYNNNSIAVH